MDEAESRLYVEQFSGVLEWLPDAVVVVDSEGSIVIANRNAETLLGYRQSELVGMPVEALLPERARASHADHRRRYAAAPVMRPMGTELALVARRKDGAEVSVEISLGPVYTGDRLLVIATLRSRDPVSGETAGVQIGDAIVIGDDPGSAREGVIVEVLAATGRRGYRVRWQDGGESVYYPAAGVRICRRPGG